MQFGFVKRQLVLRQSRRSQKLPYGSSFVRSGQPGGCRGKGGFKKS